MLAYRPLCNWTYFWIGLVFFMGLHFASAQEQARDAKSSLFTPVFAEQAKGLLLHGEQESAVLKLVPEPLMRFTVTDTIFGSVFLWLDGNRRPAVIGTIGSIEINRKDEGFCELHLLSSNKLQPFTVSGDVPKLWNPVPMEETAPIDTAPVVAASAPLRLSQMRTLARFFSVEMNAPDGKPAELRLLPQPLYRYENPTVDRDGAIFAFVWTAGTDPELLLRIESRLVDGKPTWCMQPLRFTWRSLTLLKSGAMIWEGKELKTRDNLVQTTPYVTTLTTEMRVKE
jgi:hypothetical protein